MLKALSKKQIKASKLHLKVIRSSIALVLSLMFGISRVAQDSGELDQHVTLMKKTVVETMHEFLNTWIKRVVGSVFGGMWERTISTRLERETKVHVTIICCCRIIIKVCTSADLIQLWQDLLELRCPPPVEQNWHGLVETIVTERVKRLNPEEQLDMLCELENGSHASSSCNLITNIFITESIAALEKLVFSQVSLITCMLVLLHIQFAFSSYSEPLQH